MGFADWTDIGGSFSIGADIGGDMSVSSNTVSMEDALRIVDGTKDYNRLDNRPSIESVLLEGDKTFAQLGLLDITEQEIDNLLYG